MGAETFVGIGLVAFAILFLGYMSYKCSRDKARVPPPAKPVETPAYNPTALTEMEDGRGSGSFVVLQDKVRDSNILDASPPSQTHVSAKLVSFSVGSSVGVGSHFVVTKPTATDDIAILEDEEDDDMMVIQHAPMKKLGDGLAEDDFDIVDQDLYRSSTSFSKGMDGRYSHFSMVSELSAYETASEYESRMSQASRDSYMTDYDGKEARI
ncbi:hypothetical protein SDRG_08234 [Saprolegnia diclina VS20]|uniref:Uncharacterized protein n=1 Tax=Saprolegnia diclina (strain VS20) TaxID=1156394 RepID=T0RNS4_SAPDV|nr:hypothetical protein SDRG_08234 [Saprolegnia diclina VS20]EQC34018.1 hypothetical protein SDRG_08234 [Saprolegnia diclina VS20]|eukprot:XP_008612330.1 hypothetical protein SDRG_08234 [Saprolegnia diclina VS20]